MMEWITVLPPIARSWAVMLLMGTLGLLVHATIYGVVGFVTRRVPRLRLFEGALLARSRGPTRILFPLFAARSGLVVNPGLFDEASTQVLVRVLDALMILAVTWLFVKLTYVMEDIAYQTANIDAEDNLAARRVRTRIGILRQILTAVVAVIGIGMVLMLHPTFRTLGTGMLASAGIAGIVIGIAAQRPIGNLLAGVQIALTQPFRVDDVVIVEGEWGQIEEITLTYVVVRIWDLRRLVVPISYFLEKPFQNWTRTSASILGTVFFHVDFRAPVEEMRAHLTELVQGSSLWDGQVCVLQVTELTERTMQIRALVSASNAGRAFDLRCEVREKMILFLQQRRPDALPRTRAYLEPSDAHGRERSSPGSMG